MEKLNAKALHRQAKEALAEASFSPFKMILVYTLVTVLSGGLYTVLSYYLNTTADAMNELRDLTLRSRLYSLDATLSIVLTVFQVFWNFSYLIFTIRASRREPFGYGTFQDGFRLWKRMIGGYSWMLLRFMGISVAYLFLAFLCSFSLLLISAVSAVFLGVIVYYMLRYWAVPYLAADKLELPTASLCFFSSVLTRGRKWQLCKVFLHFFYYFIPIALIESAPTIFLLFQEQELSLLTYSGIALVQLALVFLLQLWLHNEVNVTYACAYNHMLLDNDLNPAAGKRYLPDD